MKTLEQIELIDDLDARVINAAALLEYELRARATPQNEAETLGELVQQYEKFSGSDDEFHPRTDIHSDVNSALGVRNTIAHWAIDHVPTEVDRERASKHLLTAVRRVREESENNRDKIIAAYQKANTFDHEQSQAALARFHQRRGWICLLRITLVPVALIPMVYVLGLLMSWKVPFMQPMSPMDFMIPIVSGLTILNAVHAGARMFNMHVSANTYYRLPGSRYENGDHRCVYCGHRGKRGRGIYGHVPHKSLYKLFDCTICGSTLYARGVSIISLLKPD